MRPKIAVIVTLILLSVGVQVAAGDYYFHDDLGLSGTATLSTRGVGLKVVLREGFMGDVGLHASAGWEGDFQAGTTSSGLDEAYVTGLYQEFLAWFVGRRRIAWGPGESGLLLSGNAPAFRSWGYELRVLGARYMRFYGWLEPELRRYLLGHRFETEPVPGLRLGISEAAVVSGNFSPLLLNPIPFWPLYLSQYIANAQIPGHDDRANLVLSYDIKYELKEGGYLYWEYLADNQPLGPGDSVPYQTAWRLGARLPLLPEEGISLTGQLIRVNPGTYAHRNPDNAWVYRGEILGFPLGADVEQVNLALDCRLDANTTLSWIYAKTRQGESKTPSTEFPTGVVESTDRLGIGWTRSFGDSWEGNLTIYQDWVENPDHTDGETTTAGFRAGFSFRFGV